MSDALTLCWGIYQRQIYRKNKKKKKKKGSGQDQSNRGQAILTFNQV